MIIKLSDEEAARIQRHLTHLNTIHEQIQGLMAQGNGVKDTINVSWAAANRRAQLEDPELVKQLAGDIIPPMVDDNGQQVVYFDTKARTASWQTVHDVKRVAEASECVKGEKCDESEG